MAIDIHAHALPQETLDALEDARGRFPSIEILREDDKLRLSFAGGTPTRPVAPRLRQHADRQQFMHRAGISTQVAGGWLDAFGYELPAEEGADWSRFQNEHFLRVCRNTPNVVPLATVPLQDGKLAARVLEEAVNAGLPGAMIGTLPFGDHGNLDDPQLDPFWSQAAQLQVPIIIHPTFGSSDARLNDYEMMNAVGRVSDVTTAIARLLFSGHFLRFETLVAVASTGGGALPYMLGRLERNYLAHPNRFADPREGFAKLYFDSIVFQTDALRYLVGKVGAHRVMLGSDYPFPIGDPEPRKVIEDAGFSDAEVELMLNSVARDLFKL